ncbi:hypothetical protein ACU6QK_15615 [Pseudomonas rhodesiae]
MDYSELKRLAEAAISGEIEENEEFRRSCRASVISGLIYDNEILRIACGASDDVVAKALCKDAERYRWLRAHLIGISSDFDDSGKGVLGLVFKVPGERWIGCDDNIDAAMSRSAKPNEA